MKSQKYLNTTADLSFRPSQLTTHIEPIKTAKVDYVVKYKVVDIIYNASYLTKIQYATDPQNSKF